MYPFNTVVEVPKWWNRKDIESPKIFKLEPTGSVPALVSNKVYTRNTGIVSADHCNHRSPLKTYKLDESSHKDSEFKLNETIFEEALSGLIGLGYKNNEARNAINEILSDSDNELDVETIVRNVLKKNTRKYV